MILHDRASESGGLWAVGLGFSFDASLVTNEADTADEVSFGAIELYIS